MGLVGMAAAPLRAPGGEVIGTLAISTAQPRMFEADDLDLLQGLADQAAIALTNSNLLARVTLEEARFRGLVQTTPDVIWRADVDGVFTFMADSGEQLFGWPVDRIVGEHFGFLTHLDSMPIAREKYQAVGRDPDLIERVPLVLVRRDGSTFAAEVTTAGVFEDGKWVGAQGTVRDVSERARLERELRESEERYRYLVQNAPDLIWSIDADASITFLSDAVERLTGLKPEELLGQHFGALVHESSSEVADFDWTTAMEAGSQEVRGRINLRHRDGTPVAAEFIAVASLDEGGRFEGANGSVRDMRERDRLERDLRASEDRYRNLASSSPDMVFATDAEGRYTFLSDRASTMLGWDLEASLGRPFVEFVAPGWEAEAAASYRAVIDHPSTVHSVRIDFLDGSGAPRPLEINVLAKVEDGVIVGINGVARDISERLRLERELSQSEERYRFLVQNSPDIVFATDAEGRFTFLSDAIERVTGHRAADMIGRHFTSLIDQTTGPVAGNRWAELVANPEREQQAALVLVGPDGRRVPVDVRAIGVTDDDGRFAGIQGATRDVSDQVRLENELRRQAGELAAGEERAHLARELHDSVTQALFSMTLVSRSVEMLLEKDPAGAREQLGQLRELQREALAEMRALIFELRPGNLEQDGLVRALKTHASALQGRLGLPIVVESDLADRLPLPAEEVLYRIAQEALHNVVKHAAARRIRVDVRHDAGGVRLRVEDDGKGFDPERVPDGHLGLAGMRARADRIGAEFSCASRPGEGTTVEVRMAADTLAELASAAGLRPPTAAEAASIRDG
jgi:PAS domain S-box-containing protein